MQGVAEVVPVSSSAQLTLVPWLLGWEQPADRTAFGAALHAGSCLGICWALRDDLWALDRRTLALVAACSVPAASAGALAADRVEQRLGRPPQLAVLLAGVGLLLWAVDARAEGPASAPGTVPLDRPLSARRDSPRGAHPQPDDPTRAHPVGMHEAAFAALAQVAALAPGVSRSGATLTALRAAGVDRAAAERFSLLMSLPVTAGAALLTLARADRTSVRAVAPSLATGVATAALAGAAAAYRQRSRPARPPTAAVLYRVALAALVAGRLYRDRTAGSRHRSGTRPRRPSGAGPRRSLRSRRLRG